MWSDVDGFIGRWGGGEVVFVVLFLYSFVYVHLQCL